LIKIQSTIKKNKILEKEIRQETDIDRLSIPEEKTGTKRHSGAFPKDLNASPLIAIELNSIQMEFDNNLLPESIKPAQVI
jgi:hypothetical protein